MKTQKLVKCNSKEEDNYVDERCQICGKRMVNIRYIWIGIEDDRYYCQSCRNKYNIDAVECNDI